MAQVVVGRKNQFFLPGDGIDREVIQADICKYLDNDATVRPGQYNGDGGFYIHAYRNLTTEQVNDIRADSLKLKRERQEKQEKLKAQASRKRGRDPPISQPAQVPYADSATHSQSVQRHEDQQRERERERDRERERQRLRSEAPHGSVPAQSYAPPTGPSHPGCLPTPISQRSEQGYPTSPPTGAPSLQAIRARNTPPLPPPQAYLGTPESQYSQPPSATLDTRMYDDGYQSISKHETSYHLPQSAAARSYQGQQVLHPQMPRPDDYIRDYDVEMDIDTDDYYAPSSRIDLRAERTEPRSNRMDTRQEWDDRDRDMRKRDMRDDWDHRDEHTSRMQRDSQDDRPPWEPERGGRDEHDRDRDWDGHRDRDVRADRDVKDVKGSKQQRDAWTQPPPPPPPPSRALPPRKDAPTTKPQQRTATRMDMRPGDPVVPPPPPPPPPSLSSTSSSRADPRSDARPESRDNRPYPENRFNPYNKRGQSSR